MKDKVFSDERSARLSMLPLPLPSGREKLRALSAQFPTQFDANVPSSDMPPCGQGRFSLPEHMGQSLLREDRVDVFPRADALLSCAPKRKDRLVVIGEETEGEGAGK